MRRAGPVALLVCAALALAGVAGAVAPGELDDFSASTEGWLRGTRTSGGQGGAGDFYLQLVSDGLSQNGRLVTFNQSQWAGDWLAARVKSLAMSVNNLGATELRLRLAFGDTAAPNNGGTWFVSTTPLVVPAGSGWTLATFPTDCASLTRTQGTKSCAELLGGVATLRLLHAVAIDDQGTPVAATLGVDQIAAPREVPAFPTGP